MGIFNFFFTYFLKATERERKCRRSFLIESWDSAIYMLPSTAAVAAPTPKHIIYISGNMFFK